MSAVLPTFFGQTVVAQYEIADFQGTASTRLVDGTKMAMDSSGRVTQVQYASGVAVRRHINYVLVRSANSSYWFGDSDGRWYPLD